MTHNEQKEKLFEVFKTLSDEQVIDLWDTYHSVMTCDLEKCFFENTEENRAIMFDVYGREDVLTAIFHNNFGYNLSCEYFRFFSEPLIEGYSTKQARRLITDDQLDAIANNLVIEQETLGRPYIRDIISDVRGEVEEYLMSIDPLYLAELYCDFWNKTHEGDGDLYGYFIRPMSMFDDEFQYDKPLEIAQYIVNSYPHFDPTHKYFKGYKDRITTSDDVFDLMNFSALVDHIVNEHDALSDNHLKAILSKSSE